MSEHTPSRLPTAFVRVSKCPICRYSLKDLADDAPCPECGTEIDRVLFTSTEFNKAVMQTKDWCTLCIGSWAILGAIQFLPVIYAIGTVQSGQISILGLFFMLFVMVIVLTGLIVSVNWYRNAHLLVYRTVHRSRKGKILLPRRVIGMTMLGLGLLMLFAGLCVFN